MGAPTPSLKDQGNGEFKAGQFLKAAALYSKAIKEDEGNAVLYSNRSAALLKLNKVTKACADAEECIKLRPDWEKGYFRKGAVLEALQKPEEALQAYQEAQRLNPANLEVADKVKTLSSAPTKKGFAFPATTVNTASKEAPGRAADEEEQLQGFMREVLQMTQQETMAEGLASMTPAVYFWPRKRVEGEQEQMVKVGIQHAFDSPEVRSQCTDYLRQTAQESGFTAACLVAPRHSIAYPQVWKEKGWKQGDQEGVFVQFQTRGLKDNRFLPFVKDEIRAPVKMGKKHELLETLIH